MVLQATKTLIVVAGPTASGKTDLAIRLANTYQTEIISADSRQFYDKISIGTAKPSAEELQKARHHFIGSHQIEEEVSAGRFEQEAIPVISGLFRTQDIAILVGGSGLFLDVICRGIDDLPKADPGIRDALNKQLQEQGLQSLLDELETVDPAFFAKVDRNNPRRVTRALEIWRSTGQRFSDLRKENYPSRSFQCLWLGLELPRQELYDRINSRVDGMINQGLLDEARSLHSFSHLNALKTVGYTELFDYFEGKCTLSEAIEAIKRNTRKFAKRQLTWFRKNKIIRWFHPDDWQGIVYHLEQNLSKAGP